MPKKGYKSFTVPDHIFNQLEVQYQKNRVELGCRGITSVTGYAISLISESLPTTKVEN